VLSAIATELLVPPVNFLFIAFAGMALARWRPVAGTRVTLAALLGLLLLALPAVSVLLLLALESGTEAKAESPAPGAIVILGGDAAPTGPRLDQEGVGTLTLERLRAGAALARASGLPVLLTGGVVSEAGPPVAQLMAQSLARDFGLTARWVEPASKDTWENAAFSAALLRRDGIGTVLLVTHAWHMRRALIAFRAAGLTVVPAPLPPERAPYILQGRLAAEEFVPRVSAWQRSYFALHEWIGCAWYALRASTRAR
jgi:uncharacterized SAM-binding protein YcdF (DUF218 family)